MAIIGAQMMMLKQQVTDLGMFEVMRRLHEMDVEAVEVSQIPMNEENTAGLLRATKELSMTVGALSVALKAGPTATGDTIENDYDKIVADCRLLGTRYVRIGMMPFTAMVSKEACEAWAAEVEPVAARLAADGITLCYHNHHVDLTRFGGELMFDVVRRVAPSLMFEVDLHWVQRGGMAPLDMLASYKGVCRLIHVKDFRIVPVPQEAVDKIMAGDFESWMRGFMDIAQFAEVGQGNMNWPALLPASIEAGAEFFFIEQDDTYGRDPFDCIRESREYLKSIGY